MNLKCEDVGGTNINAQYIPLFIQESTSKRRNPSGPKAEDPYAEQDGSSLLPVFVAVGAFIPILVCLCKI